MRRKFYFDSDVWIAYFDKKDERHELAVKLFEEIIRSKSIILISTRHHTEMINTGFHEKFEMLKNKLFENKLCFGIKPTEIDKQIAYRHNEILRKGYGDCLHLEIAKRNKAIAVSFDKHWQEIGNVINKRVYFPEEALQFFFKI